ncbi:Hypothetical predicted protein [Paramuricea clavata]|uniref:Uncharacterized protein n=1 Tax=Paramuricea clavata TaxID=317549 RepID=A0A7D9JCJ9_PARCT|nr:Hypothetical predicted protein [Paramuricea clavata]
MIDDDNGRNGGLDNREYKGSTYWRTSFEEICVGMKYGGDFIAFSFSYPAASLYNLIADGNYRQTHVGREQWKSLIDGSSLHYSSTATKRDLKYSLIATTQVFGWVWR